MKTSLRVSIVMATMALLAALTFASPCMAELTERGDLFVRFHGGIEPTALPRQRLASIAVNVGGMVKTLSGEQPPALRKIEIELNRAGKLDAGGLPTCRYENLVAASQAGAMEACGSAFVGTGTYTANTAFPEQPTFPSRGRILAFNGVAGGKEAIFAHIYGGQPAPISRIVVFHVHRKPGTYGTVITGRLSSTLNHYGYITGLTLDLHRRYSYRGQPRSYLSAACAAPSGFSAAAFPFARASMTFADGRALSSTLTRSCTVRG